MRMPRPTSIMALVLCGSVGGCALTAEKYQRPAVSIPTGWQGGVGEQAAWPDPNWWRAFQSDELDSLITEAQANNRDLKAAAARVAQARAVARIAGAPRYPTVDVAAEAKRKTGAGSLSGTNPGNKFTFLPEASYELDIWGFNRLTSEAAEDAVLSSSYAQEVVRMTLTADVATTYFQILSLNDRLDVAQRNVVNAQKLMDLVNEQEKAGRVSPFEVERQSAQLATAEAGIPPLQQQLRVARDALAVLLGKNPEDLTLSTTSLRPFGAPTVPLGLPPELLERRPDIRSAEMNLVAANANLGAARAALFPQFTLATQIGYAGKAFPLFTAANRVQTISLAMLATIFDGGKLRGQVDLAAARKLELAETYQQSIVSAFRDVEDALEGIRQFGAQQKLQEDAAAHAREAYRIAELQLRAGATDFTAVLDAERTLLSAETAVDDARFARYSSIVGLYRALGGGWSSP